MSAAQCCCVILGALPLLVCCTEVPAAVAGAAGIGGNAG